MRDDIPALSLREPWAWAILHLGKSIENRTWATSYRGPILLHAAKTWDAEGSEWLLDHGYEHPTKRCFELAGALGAYVGEVDLLKCVPVDSKLKMLAPTWAFGPICWILAHPIAYPDPIPARGYMGLYDPRIGTRWPQGQGR